MPVYAYKGMGAGSRSRSGTVDAENPRDARLKLRSEGIFPTELVEGKPSSDTASESLSRFKLPELRRGVPDLELSLFTNQLSTLLAAGVPLVQSLEALTDQIENVRLKTVVGRLRENVNQGTSLADALSQHPTIFDELFCSMVRAGESSGALDLVLRRLGEYVENRMRLQNQITSAMTYPAMMLIASTVVIGILLVKVIPTITQLLEGMGQELPFATVVVIAASELVTDWWLPMLIFVGATVIGLTRAIDTERGRLVWDRLRLRVPVLGRAVRLISISRFSRTLSTLLSGGVPIVRALEIASSTAGNQVIALAVGAAREAITRGSSIAQPLRQSGEFPPLVTHMISVGEASGELDTMLNKVADTYDELVGHALKRLLDLLGPLLLLFVAGVVVLILLSTLLPIMNLTANL
jgi:general secretion pathway protein F